MRDRTVGDTFYMYFTTRAFATGIPTVLAGTPVVSAYEDDNATEITAGITLGVDHDSVAGLNLLTIVATGGNGFETGKDYSMVITTGTVGGVSVVGEVVGEFSLDLSAALKAVDLLNNLGGTAQTGDNFARLGAPAGASVSADIADVPTNSEFNARTLLASAYFDPAADTVNALVQGFLTTSITETSAGRIANNFDFFYDNANAQTAQVVDDVGGGGGGGTDWTASERNEIRGRLGVTGTTAAGGNTPTLSTQVSVDDANDKLDTIIVTQENQNPVEQDRTSDVVTTGTETGTSANTLLQDGTEWVLTSIAGGIDAVLIFNIGTDSEIPSSYHTVAYFDSGKGRALQIQAFNFNQNAYENRGGVQNNAASLHDISLGLTDSHVRRGQGGTPGVDGDVRIRFLYDLTVSGKVSAGDDWHIDVSHVNWIKSGTTLGDFLDVLNNANPQRNYGLGAITIDTENGVPGTDVGINGTPGNPSNNITDARILADALGFNRYVLEGFITVLTLDQNYDNWQFMSVVFGGTVNGNGQSTDGAVFLNMQLEGAFVGEIDCTQCSLKGITTEGFFQQCTLPQNPSVTLTGNSNFRGCDSTLPGVGNPGIDANNVAGLSVSFTKYAGGLDLSNLDNAANVTVSGRGSLALTDAATTATVIVSGHMRLTGALPTGINLTDTARIDTEQIDTAFEDYDGPTNAEMNARTLVAANYITVSDILTTQMTEAYAADGVAPTLTQALMLIQQALTENENAGVTQTIKKLDGSTTAATLTLNDATNPTGLTRTT